MGEYYQRLEWVVKGIYAKTGGWYGGDVVELVFVFGFPLALGAWLHRRFGVSWLLFVAGAVTFG
ncbi:MAG: hypothetical protein JRF61_14285, partial [Deltaproteobacteria bacterium]|nr:hypothetical protein [Deltaproteobacteria bacterium]